MSQVMQRAPSGPRSATSGPIFQQPLGTRLVTASLLSVLLIAVWPRYIGVPLGPVKASPIILWQLLFLGLWLLAPSKATPDLKRGGQLVYGAGIAVVLITFLSEEFVSTLFGGKYSSIFVWLRTQIGVTSLFVAGLVLGQTERRLSKVVSLLTACLTVTFSIAVLEFATQTLFMTIFAAYIPQLSDDEIQNLFSDRIRNGNIRTLSTYAHPIILGIVSSSSVSLFLAKFQNSKSHSVKLMYATGAVIAVGAAVSTGSRSVVVSLAASVPVYLFLLSWRGLIRRGSPLIFGLAFAAVPLAVLAAPSIGNLVQGRTSNEAESTAIRAYSARLGAEAIAEHPFFGSGTGSSPELAGTGNRNSLTIDDSYLTLMIDDGTAGVVLFATFCIMTAYFGIGLITRLKSDTASRLIAAMLAFSIGVLVGQKGNSIPFAFAYVYLTSGVVMAGTVMARGTVERGQIRLFSSKRPLLNRNSVS